MTVARKLARYKLDLVGVRRACLGQRGHTKNRRVYVFLWKRKWKSEIGNSNLYNTEEYQQSRE